MLVDTSALDSGAIRIRLADWSFAGRAHQLTATPTSLRTPEGGYADPADGVYQAPEDRWGSNVNRVALDMFSLGALAYLLVSGEAPARDRAGLLNRVRDQKGLDLASAAVPFVDDRGERLRELVLKATNPHVSERVELDPNKGTEGFGAQDFLTALRRATKDASSSDDVDALNPPIEGRISERFEVVKILGSGSTARGILVHDTASDNELRVLKVALDDSCGERLHEEADVLRRLDTPALRRTGVVQLIDGPLSVSGDRTAILLSNCGDHTLADYLRHNQLPEPALRSYGRDLLDMAVALDDAGIRHRDIKPANLGLVTTGVGRSKRTRLHLFDFSLTRANVDKIKAGTPPYRDPFLGLGGKRSTYDSAAESYAIAVVLYEMATGMLPVYGDGFSDAASIDDDVSVSAATFINAGIGNGRAAALTDFFRRALAREAGSRFGTVGEMRQAWLDVFVTPDDAPPPRPTPVPEEPVAADEPYSDLRDLVHAVVAVSGSKPSVQRRRVVAAVLGHAEANARPLDDPFLTLQKLGRVFGLDGAQVKKILDEHPTLWHNDSRAEATMRLLVEQIDRMLAAGGGVSTPNLTVQVLLARMRTEHCDDPTRLGMGLLRLLDAESDGQLVVRRQETGAAAMVTRRSELHELLPELTRRAQRLVDEATTQGLIVVPPTRSEPELRTVAARTLGVGDAEVEIDSNVLFELATTGSATIALSSLGELHPVPLALQDAVRILLRNMPNTPFSPHMLDARLKARFPAVELKLPPPRKLPDLMRAVAPELRWVDGKYQYLTEPAQSRLPTHHGNAGRGPTSEQEGEDIAAVLAASVRDRSLLALGVPFGGSDDFATALVARFDAVTIDVTDILLTELRRRAGAAGIRWDAILAADAGGEADRHGLRSFIASAVPDLVAKVESVQAPTVVTDVSTLASYGQLGVIGAWADLNHQLPHAVWVLVPQRAESGGLPGPRVDTIPLPLHSPTQFIQIDESTAAAFIALGSTEPETVR